MKIIIKQFTYFDKYCEVIKYDELDYRIRYTSKPLWEYWLVKTDYLLTKWWEIKTYKSYKLAIKKLDELEKSYSEYLLTI